MHYYECYDENFRNRCIEEHIWLSTSGYKIISHVRWPETFRHSVSALRFFKSDIIDFSALSKTEGICLLILRNRQPPKFNMHPQFGWK